MLASDNKGDKPQDGGKNGQDGRDDLVIECPDIGSELPAWFCFLKNIVIIDYVQRGVYRQPAKQDEGCKAPLVEIETKQVECEENPDKGNGYHGNDGQRLQERLQQYGTENK